MAKQAVFVAALALSSAFAAAQSTGITPNGVQSITTDAAVTISTTDFHPQIQLGTSKYVLMPENPSPPDPMDLFSRPNRLKTGSANLRPRVVVENRFPVIDATGWTPPDPNLAVGPTHVVSVVNSRLAFHTRAGTAQFSQNMFGSTGFFGTAGATDFVFDPRAFYDQLSNRFFVLAAERQTSPQTSFMLIGVSDDSDPNGTWYLYRVNSMQNVGGQNYWMDYPSFGYNKDAIAICGNMFGFSSGTNGTLFMALPKAALLTGAPATVNYQSDTGGFSYQLAHTYDPGLEYIYAVRVSGTSAVRVAALGNLLATPSYTNIAVTVPTISPTVSDAPSNGGRNLDTIDGRIMNVAFAGGRLVATHTTAVSGSDSRNAARWYEVQTNSWPASGTPSLRQSGQVVGAAGEHVWMPAICTSPSGEIALFASRSTSTTAPVFVVSTRRANDPLGAMGAPVLLESSLGATYGSTGTNRWGDYFGAVVDPLNGRSFWGIGMTANATGGWRTHVHSVSVALPTIQSLTVSPTSVEGGVGSTGSVELIANAPAGGAVVALASSDTSGATVPATVTVPAGQRTATFAVTTLPVATGRTTLISASYQDDRVEALLNVVAQYRVAGRVANGPNGVQGATVQVTGPAPTSSTVSASPGLPIQDNATIDSTVTFVPVSTVTSVQVNVNITHTYRGDLQVSILHPDGTQVVLHNRSGGSADNLVTGYPDPTASAQPLDPLFGKPTNGTWTLRVADLASQDTGTLNSWSLTLGYTGTSTRNLTTDASGAFLAGALSPGSYTVTASKAGFNVTPASRTAVVGPSQLAVDFVATPQGAISGTVTLQGLAGSPAGRQVTLEIRNPGSTAPLETLTATLDASGNYQVQTVRTGTYDLAFKASHWLRAVLPSRSLTGSVLTGQNVSLLNGDIVPDNVVDIGDFLSLAAAYETVAGDPAWDEACDLNGDGAINLDDFLILAGNYEVSGQP